MTQILSKEQIQKALKEIQDPELKRDIVSLGMVKEIEIQGASVAIQLAMAGGLASVKEKIREEVRQKISSLDGIEKVTVEVSHTPAKGPVFASKAYTPGIRHVVAVASGKGGVGKTTVAVNLAIALAKKGNRVGLMDADIYGPNVPLMLGVPVETRPRVNNEDKMIPIEVQGLKMISMGVLVPPDQPMVWRGPMLHGTITQFIQKVDWGELDFLIVDLPPGTGDVQLSLVQTVPLTGAVIVTTPQEVALMDVRKGVAMFRKTNVPILGVVENMTGEIFGSGGGRNAAVQFQVPFLGEIPLDRRIREGGDKGAPIVLSDPDSPAGLAFSQAAGSLMEIISMLAAPAGS